MIRRLVIHPSATQDQRNSISTIAWELDGADVKFRYREGSEETHRNDRETFDDYARKGRVCGVPVVEDIQPWKDEVERLEKELASAQADAKKIRDSLSSGHMLKNHAEAMKLGMKDVAESITGDMLAYIRQLVTERDELDRSADAWRESAAQAARDKDYYRSLVVKIGNLLGEAAKTCDDGSKSEDVLCDKVPELVDRLLSTKVSDSSPFRAWEKLSKSGRIPPTSHSIGTDILDLVDRLDAEIEAGKQAGKVVAAALDMDERATCDQVVAEVYLRINEAYVKQMALDVYRREHSEIVELCKSHGYITQPGELLHQGILRYIRNLDSANGHLADDLKKAHANIRSIAKELGMPESSALDVILARVRVIYGELQRSDHLPKLWKEVATLFGMDRRSTRTYSDDIIAFIRETVESKNRILAANGSLISGTTDLRRENNVLKEEIGRLKTFSTAVRGAINLLRGANADG